MEDWVTQLAATMERLDGDAHTGCAPDYEKLMRSAVASLVRQANDKLCAMCPDPCDSLKPWRCTRPGSPWYWEDD